MIINCLSIKMKPGTEFIKRFSCSTQLSTKLILLIIVETPIIVGILTIISMIKTTPERFKARNLFICRRFSFLPVEISCSDELRMIFFNLGAW